MKSASAVTVDLDELEALARGECRYCDRGFPVYHGVHFPTQALGMIPNTACDKYSALLERRAAAGLEPLGAPEWRATTLALLQELRAHREREASGGWVACSERMPGPGAIVSFIALGQICVGRRRFTERRDGYAWDDMLRVDMCGDCDHYTTEQVTHWMPRPKPPAPPEGSAATEGE